MSRAGRKRKQQMRRERNGRIDRGDKPEREDKIMGIALAQPHRNGDRSQLVGYALGRLMHTGQISIEQFNAGETYGRLAGRYMRDVLGSSYHWPKSGISEFIGGSAYATFNSEPDPENVVDTERSWADAMSALADHGLLRTGVSALAHIILMDRDPSSQTQLGDARLSLNILHKLWGSNQARRHAPARFDAESASC